MRLLKNAGIDRVIDLLEPALQPGGQFDVVTPAFSLFAFSALQSRLAGLLHSHIVIPTVDGGLGLLGNEADRPARNQLQSRWLARQCAEWAKATAMVRVATGKVPQGVAVVRDAGGAARQVVMGAFGLTSDGLGITPGNPLNLIQASDTAAEAAMLSQWFDQQWSSLPDDDAGKHAFIVAL